MLAPKCPIFNGRPTFANSMYLKKAQYEKPCLYAIPHDQSDPANRLVPDREETPTLEEESRSKLNKDLVKPFDYTKTSNVNAVCATCGKCGFNSNHDACVSKFLNDVNARTKKPNVVPISTRKPKSQANKSVAIPHKKTVALESTTTNSKSYYRMLYKRTSKAWKWWIAQQCPSSYTWVPKTKKEMDLYNNFSSETTSINSNLSHLKHHNSIHGYRIDDFSFNIDYINLLSKKDIVNGLPNLKYVKDQLCSSCELGKAKRSSFKSKIVPSSKGRLNLLHMDLCGPMRVASINGKRYILVIVDDYSRYTWTLFLRSKDETP
ncbi:retrovirus-related pol polyprotein from transposon TNT 1-94 [Tanacetum coccineum]